MNLSVLRAALLSLYVAGVGCAAPEPAIAPRHATAPARVIGASAPTALMDAALDGSWVAICQARRDTNHDGRLEVLADGAGTRGDAQAPYLVVGAGPGGELEDIVATDPTHRRLAIVRNGRVMIEQFALGPAIDLTALGAARPVRFSPDGERVAYTLHRATGDMIGLYDIATGARRELVAGPGVVWWFYFDDGGGWLHVEVATPGTPLEPGERACTTRFRGDVIGPDVPVTSLVISIRGDRRSDEHVRATVGDALIEEAPDGALELVRGDAETELVPASCGSWVLATVPDDGSVYVACTKLGDPRAPVFEYGARGERALGVGVVGATTHAPETSRYLPDWLDDYRRAVIDLKTGRVYPGTKDQFGIYFDDHIALIWRTGQLVAIADSTERVLGAIERNQSPRRTGNLLFVAPLVVDVRTAKVVGVAPPRAAVLALGADGRLLIGRADPAHADAYPMGPLEWVSAARAP